MSKSEFFIGMIICIVSIFLISAIMLQENNSRGLASISGSSSESFYNKNKGRTFDAMLTRLTKVSAVLFFSLILTVGIIKNFVK